MGTLRPGATYEYTYEGDLIFARDVETNYKKIIGSNFPISNVTNWYKILKEAETNVTLQHAIDRVIMIYELSRDHGKDRT